MHINMYKLFLEHLVMIIQMWAYMLFIFYCVFKFYAMHMHFTFIFRKKNKAIPKSFQFKIHLNALKLKMLTYNVTNLTRNCWWFILTCDEDLVAYNFQWASLSPELQKLDLYKEKDIVLNDNTTYDIDIFCYE